MSEVICHISCLKLLNILEVMVLGVFLAKGSSLSFGAV